jgi:hypothetical protein
VTWLVGKFPVVRDLNPQICVNKSSYTGVHDYVSSSCSELGGT